MGVADGKMSETDQFFFWGLRPPQSTLFPYTTLFRSEVRPQRPFEDVVEDRQERALRMRLAGDRKSTRLNSSHLGISYAVFCLKKKNWVWLGTCEPCRVIYWDVTARRELA